MVSSSMFLTALAPNTMAIALIAKAIGITIRGRSGSRVPAVGIILTLIQPASST